MTAPRCPVCGRETALSTWGLAAYCITGSCPVDELVLTPWGWRVVREIWCSA